MTNKGMEEKLYERLVETIVESKKFNYNPSYFWQMLNDNGAVLACKKLLEDGPDKIHDGFGTLWTKGKLGLTVEAIVLELQFAPLFTEAELETARKRLEKAEYKFP